MKLSCRIIVTAFLLVFSVHGHYIFRTFIAGAKTSTKAIRQPQNNSPVHDYTSNDITCNVNPSSATETVSISAGDKIGFILDGKMYHQGPVAIYLGKAPKKASSWDGSGSHWFKIAQWGVATFNPFSFSSLNMDTFTTTIPKNTPSGEYLVRIEQAGLHLTGTPEFFMSCAQIKIVNGGSGNPPKVSIPGYIPWEDKSVMVNIYPPYPKTYTCPGPSVWRG